MDKEKLDFTFQSVPLVAIGRYHDRKLTIAPSKVPFLFTMDTSLKGTDLEESDIEVLRVREVEYGTALSCNKERPAKETWAFTRPVLDRGPGGDTNVLTARVGLKSTVSFPGNDTDRRIVEAFQAGAEIAIDFAVRWGRNSCGEQSFDHEETHVVYLQLGLTTATTD